MYEDRKSNISEELMELRGKWLSETQLGEYLSNVIEHMMEIEEEWKVNGWDELDVEEVFSDKVLYSSFLLHQKYLMTGQFIEWHGVRREVIQGQTVKNVTFKEYLNLIDEKFREEYYYTPSKEKSLIGPKRSLCISKVLEFAYTWHLEKRHVFLSGLNDRTDSIWINNDRKTLSPQSMSSYVADVSYSVGQKFLTPLDFRRIFVTEIMLLEMCGKLSTLEASNFLYSVNITREIALNYYCTKNLHPVAVSVRDKLGSDDSFYAKPKLNALREVARRKSFNRFVSVRWN